VPLHPRNRSNDRCALRERTGERQRVRFLKSARIIFNSQRSVINCTVRNMSATGALLAVPNVVDPELHNKSRWQIDGNLRFRGFYRPELRPALK
jgi:hypothetical protein